MDNDRIPLLVKSMSTLGFCFVFLAYFSSHLRFPKCLFQDCMSPTNTYNIKTLNDFVSVAGKINLLLAAVITITIVKSRVIE